APLKKEHIGKVVDKFIMQLEAQLADRHITIELTEKAREWLGEKGYSPQFGARPLSRIIQEHVKKPLAEEVLFGKLMHGGLVLVDTAKEGLVFSYPASKKPTAHKEEALVE
ncbi:MAG: ATP-dependent Clp protease ATP-binding subunit ClpA, partial [bacterium]